MSKKETTSKKKTVKTTKKKVVTTPNTVKKKTVKPTQSRFSKGKMGVASTQQEMLFEKQNYMLMGASLLLIIVGFMLMSGGNMPSPDVWDEGIIYSFRRITLAPFVVLAGLVLFIIAIFKK